MQGGGAITIGNCRVCAGRNQQIGKLVLVVRPQYFSTVLSDVASGSGTQIYVLDSRSNKLIIGADDASTNADETPEPRLIEEIAHNEHGEQGGFVAFEGKRGGRYMATYTRIPRTTWFVISTIPEKKLTAQIQSVRNQIVLVGISGFLLSIFLAYFMYREGKRFGSRLGFRAGRRRGRLRSRSKRRFVR